MRTDLRDVTLRTGDILLVQGRRNSIAELKRVNEFLVLDATTDLLHTVKAPLAREQEQRQHNQEQHGDGIGIWRR